MCWPITYSCGVLQQNLPYKYMMTYFVQKCKLRKAAIRTHTNQDSTKINSLVCSWLIDNRRDLARAGIIKWAQPASRPSIEFWCLSPPPNIPNGPPTSGVLDPRLGSLILVSNIHGKYQGFAPLHENGHFNLPLIVFENTNVSSKGSKKTTH